MWSCAIRHLCSVKSGKQTQRENSKKLTGRVKTSELSSTVCLLGFFFYHKIHTLSEFDKTVFSPGNFLKFFFIIQTISRNIHETAFLFKKA